MLGAVRVFLSEYGIELPQRFWRRFRRRRKQPSRAIHKGRVPSNAELRRIISHMPQHGRALFRLMATSGARIGETLALRVSDFVLDHKSLASHAVFRAETTKTGAERNGSCCYPNETMHSGSWSVPGQVVTRSHLQKSIFSASHFVKKLITEWMDRK